MRSAKKTTLSAIIVVLGICGLSTAQETISPDYYVSSGFVTAIDDPTMMAGKPGIIMAIPERGDVVSKDEEIARIDDTEALLAVIAAKHQYDVAVAQAENDVDIRYAKAQEGVTKAEWDEAVNANRRVPGTKSESEIRRLAFQHQRSILATEQTQRDHDVAQLQVGVRKAEFDVARQEVIMRRVKSVVDGVIAETFTQVGQWVNAGEPIARVLRLDTLRVEGKVRADQYAPQELEGRDVTVEVTLSRQQVARFDAKITYVADEIGLDDTFRVSAEIENRKEGSGYLVRPGMRAEMRIHIDRPSTLSRTESTEKTR